MNVYENICVIRIEKKIIGYREFLLFSERQGNKCKLNDEAVMHLNRQRSDSEKIQITSCSDNPSHVLFFLNC